MKYDKDFDFSPAAAERYVFVYRHGIRKVSFGPYATTEEGKNAFQRAYGYWPESTLSSYPYRSGDE